MKAPNEDFFKGFKEEADRVLFENMDFHHELKEKVRIQTRNLTPKKSNRIKNFLPVVSIAAVLLLAIVSTTMLKEKNDAANQMNTFVGEQENSNMITESALKSWQVDTVEEIKALFPEQVLVPTYTSAPFTLESIHASGISREEVYQVVINYQMQDQFYSVIIEKSISDIEPQGFQIVDINGLKGFLKMEETDEFLNTELIWDLNGYHYVVNGYLSAEEAVKVAKSFQ